MLVESGANDQAEISRLFAALTEEHGKRMAALGL